MGLFNEIKKLTKPYDDDDDMEAFEPKKTEDLPPAPRTTAQARGSYGGFEERRDTNKIAKIHATAQVEVVLCKPEKFDDDAAKIADHLRERRTIVLNVEQTNKDVARRIIDFVSGVAYAQDGKIKKVAVNVYIITPYNVDLLGDLIDELEEKGLYF
ncbi:MAG: cell division protein SepF [Oscillospiraceae bacterium]|nr:cell division protein SepF [Oscillospiraceae bacterium]